VLCRQEQDIRLPRRQFLQLAAGATALPIVSRIARAQTYPTRPVRIIAGFSAGSTTDIVARLVGQWLQTRLGQPFVIENRPGAGGNIATETVVRSAPDGYTLLAVSSAHAINATLYDNLKFSILRDIAPVAGIVSAPNVMVVNPSVPARTVPEFIAYAKANPGKVNMGSAGNGTSSHLAGELFKMMTGARLMHVPYRGSPQALTDLLGGQVQVVFSPMPPTVQHIRAGALRGLAVTGATRWDVLPDIPTLAESEPGYEASTWIGLGAPAHSPAEIVDRLNREINVGGADPHMKASFADMGGIVLGGSPTDFETMLAAEVEKWGKVVKFAGIKPEGSGNPG
jgi:tripartite-type tricarboxylate transporter receptor subunit TctC